MSRRAPLALLLAGALAACTSPTRVTPTEPSPPPVRTPAATAAAPSPPPEVPPAAPPSSGSSVRSGVERPSRPLAGRVIVVDAGHGGVDPGARSDLSTEKEVVLDVALRVADGLRRRGAEVHLTRERDVKIPLDDRAATASRVGADLLVSIHADAAENRAAHGFGVWIARNARRESVRAAEALLAEAARAGLSVRSLHRADFRVLVGHPRPSVLVETGFLSNEGDARRLATASHRARVASVIVDGVVRALR